MKRFIDLKDQTGDIDTKKGRENLHFTVLYKVSLKRYLVAKLGLQEKNLLMI